MLKLVIPAIMIVSVNISSVWAKGGIEEYESTQNGENSFGGLEHFLVMGQWSNWLRLRLPPVEIKEAPGVQAYREITVNHITDLLMAHGVMPTPSIVAEAREVADRERQLMQIDHNAYWAYRDALNRGEYSMSEEELDSLWTTEDEFPEARRQAKEFWEKFGEEHWEEFNSKAKEPRSP